MREKIQYLRKIQYLLKKTYGKSERTGNAREKIIFFVLCILRHRQKEPGFDTYTIAG
jgi:hypothetical protein